MSVSQFCFVQQLYMIMMATTGLIVPVDKTAALHRRQERCPFGIFHTAQAMQC